MHNRLWIVGKTKTASEPFARAISPDVAELFSLPQNVREYGLHWGFAVAFSPQQAEQLWGEYVECSARGQCHRLAFGEVLQ
jgi:hypothetical protein